MKPTLFAACCIAATSSAQADISPAHLQHVRQLIVESRNLPDPPKTDPNWAHRVGAMARTIDVDTFTYLITRDKDNGFRCDAIAEFGHLVDPAKTFPVLDKLARRDPDWKVGMQAIVAINSALKDGKLRSRQPAVEQLACDSMSDWRKSIVSIQILSRCRTPRAKRVLKQVLTGNFDAAEKKVASNALSHWKDAPR